ncbi:MAG: winged helix-turn-helix transcriptional regulator [archaeon]|nr:winged helix-turn-helix transcriptional regulator [archaeon]MCP8321635.1 winged helix-turn-helix transcriptional regulator [archaeon]
MAINELKNSEAKELSDLHEKIFRDNTKFLILKFLSHRDCASIREIARNVGMSHKNLSKYLDFLVDNGALEVVYTSPNIKLYKLSQKASIFKKFLK